MTSITRNQKNESAAVVSISEVGIARVQTSASGAPMVAIPTSAITSVSAMPATSSTTTTPGSLRPTTASTLPP